jgi:hypothetical protein
MNSQPPEDADLPEVPPEPDATPPTDGGEFVAPLEPDDTSPAPWPAGYDIPAAQPVKRYQAKIVWLWLIVSGALLNLALPLTLAAIGSLSQSGGFPPAVLLIVPLVALIGSGVGLYQSRNDELPNRRSIWMGLLIGSGLSLSCAGICYSALSGI